MILRVLHGQRRKTPIKHWHYLYPLLKLLPKCHNNDTFMCHNNGSLLLSCEYLVKNGISSLLWGKMITETYTANFSYIHWLPKHSVFSVNQTLYDVMLTTCYSFILTCCKWRFFSLVGKKNLMGYILQTFFIMGYILQTFFTCTLAAKHPLYSQWPKDSMMLFFKTCCCFILTSLLWAKNITEAYTANCSHIHWLPKHPLYSQWTKDSVILIL